MDKKEISKYVGQKIKKYRLLKGLTQKELGMMVGVKHNTISMYESGVNAAEQNILFAIAKALGVNIDDLFPATKPVFCVAEAEAQYSASDAGEVTMLPIVGHIACGNGSLAVEDIEGYEPTPKDWVTGGQYFYLRAKGDSMVGARIYDGDLLLIRKQPTVESGEIAAVMIDSEEAVLKRVYRQGSHLVLQSENPNYPPILAPPAQVRIIGKLKRNIIKY